MSRRHAQRAKQSAKREQAKRAKRRLAASERERLAAELRLLARERVDRLSVYDELALRIGES